MRFAAYFVVPCRGTTLLFSVNREPLSCGILKMQSQHNAHATAIHFDSVLNSAPARIYCLRGLRLGFRQSVASNYWPPLPRARTTRFVRLR